jgi:hypothetical protein
MRPDCTIMRSTSSFRTVAFGLTAAALALGTAAPAYSQTTLVSTPPAQTRVSEGDCLAFRRYVADEVRAFPGQLSADFLRATIRFTKAGCASADKDGPIFIITMNTQDGASLETALRRMGRVDIFGQSGVSHCHRPAGNVCPITTGTAARPTTGG